MDEKSARLVKTVLEAIQQDPELVRLSQAVEEAFRQATTRWAVPDAANCRMVALYLIALRQNPKRPKQTPKVVASGKAFLRHLEAERREIAAMVSLAHSPQSRVFGCWLPEQQELLERVDQTLQNIEWMLPRLVRQDSDRDDIRQTAACAQQAWAETNNGRAPKSRNPDDPLCRFVVAALRLIKHEYAADTVSAVLRDRRRK